MQFKRAATKESYGGSLLLNPFEVAIGVLSMLIGVAFLLSGLHYTPRSAILILPDWLVLAWAALLLAGGAAVIVGVSWRGTSSVGRNLERAGLYPVIFAWLTYTLTVAFISWQLYLGIGFGLTFAISCALRIVALSRVEKALAHAQALHDGDEAL
jgi:hypothetical protein